MKSWCWLGIHKWTKWIDKDKNYISAQKWGSSEWYPVRVELVQERRCEHCNKLKSRTETV